MDKVTFIITSSNRYDLLERTVKSFLKLNRYPMEAYLMHEDGFHENAKHVFWSLLKHVSPNVHLTVDITKIGYSKSLDKLLSEVKTEYVFTCEDDWLFNGDADFIENSLKILKARPDIHQVWIRDEHDHEHPLGAVETIAGIQVKPVQKGYLKHWGGFSLNPGLRRMSDLKRFFPNGLAEYGDEIECSKHVEKLGYKAVSMVNSSIVHIGWNRHTENFKV